MSVKAFPFVLSFVDSTAKTPVRPSIRPGYRPRQVPPDAHHARRLRLAPFLVQELLPHRQFVWTLPKVLLCYLRHDRSLFADVGRPIQAAVVSSHQAFGSVAGIFEFYLFSI